MYAMNKSKGWSAQAIKPMTTFKTVDEFWGVYQHVKRPDNMPSGTVINIFVEGIKPVWETQEHEQGGSWNIRMAKGYANQLWEDLLLGFIGEQFDCCNEVTGVVLSVTDKFDKISLWMRHGNETEIVNRVKQDMVRIMELPLDVRMEFSLFFPPAKTNTQPKSKDQPSEGAKPAAKQHGNRDRELKQYRA